MAPSHSNPKQCAATVNQIVALLQSFDNKVLIAYHAMLARQVSVEGVTSEQREMYLIVCQLMALKIQLQNERNLQNELAHYKQKEGT